MRASLASLSKPDMVLNTLGEVFNRLKKTKSGTIYVYKYQSSDQTYLMHVAGHVERTRLFRRWVRLENRKTTHLASLNQAFNRAIVGFDDDDKIFIERSAL